MSVETAGKLAHYRLREKIGEGGMGVVWKATDTRLERDIAIKFLPDESLRDPGRLARFEQEARAVAALNHPNIVTIYSVEEAGGRRFFTMELVRGRPLGALIPPDGMALERLLDVGIPIADALSAAHEHGITHRDLKPGNIMVSDEDRVKVLDFGLAKYRARAAAPQLSELPTRTLSREERISGTVPYMSPEQLRAKPVDHRTDIFSFGVMLYEMATGRRPFSGETTADLVASILKDSPAPVTGLNPELPRHLGRIIAHCLEKDPQRRFQTMLDVRNELAALRDEEAEPVETVGPSVAVLPFADMSREEDQGYFCEGIAEEIINSLGRIEGLNVASRTSAFRFRKASLGTREIGRKLRVRSLLEGSVRKSGDRLRITVKLVDVEGGFQLWSESYDRDMKDIFAIQDEIARNVVASMQVTLSPRDRSALQQVPTRDVEAYDFYLRGRNYYHQFRRRTTEFALQMFTRAIQIDPDYALAHAGIADCCAYLYMFDERSTENRERADAASLRALQLAPGMAEVQVSRGTALSMAGRHAEAEAAFQEAIRLDPQSYEAHYYYARDLFAQGLPERAVAQYERAMAVRPEDYQSPLLVAQVYADLGRESDAEAARRRGLKLAEDHLKLQPDDARALYLGANALVALGDRERGLKWADESMEMDPGDSMTLYNVACIKALAGQIEEAIDCLDRAVDHGLTQREWLEMDSNLDPLRRHPRYRALMRKLDTIS